MGNQNGAIDLQNIGGEPIPGKRQTLMMQRNFSLRWIIMKNKSSMGISLKLEC
jgi:hypothetical protein